MFAVGFVFVGGFGGDAGEDSGGALGIGDTFARGPAARDDRPGPVATSFVDSASEYKRCRSGFSIGSGI